MTDQESATVVVTQEKPTGTNPWLIALIVALIVLFCCCAAVLLSFIFAGGLLLEILTNILNNIDFYTY